MKLIYHISVLPFFITLFKSGNQYFCFLFITVLVFIFEEYGLGFVGFTFKIVRMFFTLFTFILILTFSTEYSVLMISLVLVFFLSVEPSLGLRFFFSRERNEPLRRAEMLRLLRGPRLFTVACCRDIFLVLSRAIGFMILLLTSFFVSLLFGMLFPFLMTIFFFFSSRFSEVMEFNSLIARSFSFFNFSLSELKSSL